MNFEWVMNQLEEGKKVRRPSWKENNYWKLGIDEIIFFKDGTIPHIHLKQIRATDWEIFEEKKFEEEKSVLIDFMNEFAKSFEKTIKRVKRKLKNV